MLIGAAEYPLTNAQAARLEEILRVRCLDETGLPRDDEARACLQFADVLAEDLAAGQSPEPIELRASHVEGLRAYVVDDAGDLLAGLRAAVRRYCGA